MLLEISNSFQLEMHENKETMLAGACLIPPANQREIHGSAKVTHSNEGRLVWIWKMVKIEDLCELEIPDDIDMQTKNQGFSNLQFAGILQSNVLFLLVNA